MITNLNEFKKYQRINEVRIPKGYFKVINSFSLPGHDGYDIVFNKDEILEIDPDNRTVKFYEKFRGIWKIKDILYNQLMLPEIYKVFKENSVKVDPADYTEFTNIKPQKDLDKIEFTTTVKNFPKKAAATGLDSSDKVKVETI